MTRRTHYFVLKFLGVFCSRPGGSDSKESACNAGGMGSVPGLGRSSGGGNGNPLQYSCLENSMDKGAWQATVHRVTKSQTWLKRLSKHAYMMHSDILCFIYSIILYSFLLKYSQFTISCSCRCTAQSFNFTHTHTYTYVYTHTHILFQILFLIGYYKILSMVLCYSVGLFCYLFYIQ